MHNFKELKVWQKARTLVKEVYLEVSNYPNNEKFGLTSQIKRAVVSIPSNIAEGAGRNTNKDFTRFLNISLGSAYELETQIILSNDLDLISEKQLEIINKHISEIQKMIHGLINSLDEV